MSYKHSTPWTCHGFTVCILFCVNYNRWESIQPFTRQLGDQGIKEIIMKMIVVCVLLGGAIIGAVCYQSANTKATPVKYKWGQEPPSIGWEVAPKGMTDKERMEHNQRAAQEANKRK
jgi:hypothetical protein